MHFKELKVDEINLNLFEHFQRHQTVTRCWRKIDGTWCIKEMSFTNDWNREEYLMLVTSLQNTLISGGIVFGVFSNEMLKEFTKMRDNQPSVASAGSCFKNPKGDFAGRLIEAVGLKGIKKGDMSFSELHANFLVNYGNGTFDDAIYLIDLAKQKIKDEFNIDIEEEIIIYK
mgnify:CR=1 FL=1